MAAEKPLPTPTLPTSGEGANTGAGGGFAPPPRSGGGREGEVVAAEAVEAHRRACEAREVLRWPLEQRREYLAAVERQRGKTAADILRAEVKSQHAARQKAAREIKQGRAE